MYIWSISKLVILKILLNFKRICHRNGEPRNDCLYNIKLFAIRQHNTNNTDIMEHIIESMVEADINNYRKGYLIIG